MSDNNSTDKFRLDLDAKAFIEEALKAKSAVEGIGKTEAMTELVEGFLAAGLALGAMGVALLAIKETVELVFDAEKIKQVNQQFEILSANAGLYGETLKRALVTASEGRVDEIRLMEAANKSLVQLETGYAKIPELMGLATQATKIFGGDTVQNFEAISQAVASGTTRQLRHLGIIVDQHKAMRDYATSIGTTVDALSQAGRQQAVMNAALEAGSKKLGNQKEDARQATTAWTQFKVTMTEIKDTLVLAFDKILGPTVVKFFQSLKVMATDAKRYIQANFGEGAEAATAKLELTRQKIQDISHTLAELSEKQKKGLDFTPGDTQSRIQVLTSQLKKYEAQLAETQVVVDHFHEEEKRKSKELAEDQDETSTVDLEKQKKQKAEFASSMSKIDKELFNEQMKSIGSMDDATAAYYVHLQQQGKAVQDQIDQVRAKQESGELTAAQATTQIEALDRLKTEKMKGNIQELERFQDQAWDHYVRSSHGALDAVGRSFQVTSQKAARDLQSGMKLGESATSSFSKNATSSIEAWGAGTKSATEAIAGTFAGMAGDMASQYGELMMMASIWPPNPIGFAGGVALIALGGYLKSLAGGHSNSSSIPSSSGSPGIDAPNVTTVGPQGSLDTTQATPHKAVTINIQGSYFDTEQTRQALVDMIRKEQDATDFTINRIGSG